MSLTTKKKEPSPNRPKDGHFCYNLGEYICMGCYKSHKHDMYCADTDVPLRDYSPTVPTTVVAAANDVDRRCITEGHNYRAVKEGSHTFIYCSQCAHAVRVAIGDPQRQSEITNSMRDNYNVLYFSKKHCISPSGHNYHHIQDSGKVVLFCRQCGTLIHIDLSKENL